VDRKIAKRRARRLRGRHVEIGLWQRSPNPGCRQICRGSRGCPPGAEVWSDITPIARRDWIHWIVSGQASRDAAHVGPELPATCSPKESDAVLLRSVWDV